MARLVLLLISALYADVTCTPLNVLLVILDNARPAFKAYGDPTSITPTFDTLANKSTLFSQCHTQFPWCSPSRNSFLTGRRPDQTLAWNFLDSFRSEGPSWVTLPGYFRSHNYYTTSSGKVFHPNLPPSYDTALSWSVTPYSPSKKPCPNSTMSCQLGEADLEVDGASADEMIRRLSTRANASQPFFAALGLQGARLPWVYPPASAAGYPSVLPLPNITDPSSLSHLEYYRPTEIDQYSDVHNVSFSHPMGTELQQQVRRAYYATLTNADEALAKVLAFLDTANLTTTTVVAVMADHGQNLGELNLWSMMNLLDVSTQVPLLIHTPSLPSQAPSYSSPVELVDIYPTLASLAGLPPPPPSFALDGTDLSSALSSHLPPSATTATITKDAAFSQMTRCLNCSAAYGEDAGQCVWDEGEDAGFFVPCALAPRDTFDFMGYSIRTGEWRYSVWCAWVGAELRGDWGNCTSAELYSHAGEAGNPPLYRPEGEVNNVVGKAENAQTVATLHCRLKAQFSSSGRQHD